MAHDEEGKQESDQVTPGREEQVQALEGTYDAGRRRGLGGERLRGEESKEKEEEEDIPDLRGAPGGNSSAREGSKLLSCVARVRHEYRSKGFIYNLMVRATDTEVERDFVRPQGVMDKGGMSWVPCQGTYRGERTTLDLHRKTLGRCTSNHDEYVPVGGHCYAGGNQPMDRNHFLTCFKVVLYNHMHELILGEGSVTKPPADGTLFKP